MILRAARSRGRWGEIGQESRGVKTLINAGMETCFSLSLFRSNRNSTCQITQRGTKVDLCYEIWSR